MSEQKIVRGPHPQIMRDLAELLEHQGHTCVMIVAGEEEYRFVWCQKDKCTDAAARAQTRAVADEVHRFEEELREKGHVCVTYLKCLPPIVKWCEQEVCRNTTDLHQLHAMMGPYEFAAELERRGHMCVTYLKKIPPVVEWCEQVQCKQSKGG